MVVDPSIPNKDQFVFRDCVIGGDECVLIFPSHLGVDWTFETLSFRSVILRKSDNKVISCGHLKFFNAGEKPHLYPDPTRFDDWRIWTKLDGSLIIVSKHNGELVIRTRGTSTIDVYETGPEVRRLLADFGAQAWLDFPETHSLLFEHTTPANIIVIPYDKPSLTLLDIIDHETLTYLPSENVDAVAERLGCTRPDSHSFDSLDEIATTLKTLRGIEGYVLAYNGNANRVKCKAEDYLLKHRFKSQVTLPNMLDLFFTYGRPDQLAFLARIESEFDYECSQGAKPFVLAITEAASRVEQQVTHLTTVIQPLKLLTRARAAQVILSTYKATGTSGVAFTLLDGRPVADKAYRQLIESDLASSPA